MEWLRWIRRASWGHSFILGLNADLEREREFLSFLHGFDLLWQIFARNRCSCRPLRLVGIIRRSLDLILCASSCLRLHRKVRRIIRQLRLKHWGCSKTSTCQTPCSDRSWPSSARLEQGQSNQGSSSASSSAGSTFSRASSNFSRPFSRGSAASSNPARRVMNTEVPEDGEEDEPEMIPAETQHETAVVKPALEDILQTQAGCFAAELQEAEEMGGWNRHGLRRRARKRTTWWLKCRRIHHQDLLSVATLHVWLTVISPRVVKGTSTYSMPGLTEFPVYADQRTRLRP